jgi:outer membrane protein TolC
VESARGAYRVGRVEATTLLESRMAVNRYEIERLRLAAEYRQALAEIEALTRTASGVEE